MALLLAALAVAGCTSSATTEATPTPAPTAAPTAPPTATPAPTPAPTPATTPAPTLAPTATSKPTSSDLPWINYEFSWSHSGPVVLTINGKVNQVKEFRMDDLKDFSQHHIDVTMGTKSANGTGPYLSELLDAAGVQGDATTVTFTSSDSPPYSKSLALADINGAYAGGVVAILDDGTLRIILPGGASSGNWVRNLVTITVS